MPDMKAIETNNLNYNQLRKKTVDNIKSVLQGTLRMNREIENKMDDQRCQFMEIYLQQFDGEWRRGL